MELEKAKKTGKVLKTHGKQGEIFIGSEYNLPEEFQKVESIFIRIDGHLVPFFLRSVVLRSTSTAAIKLEDVETVEEASEFIGLEWFLPEKTFQKLFHSETSYDSDALKGYAVYDQENNLVGEILAIQHIPSNTLLEVKMEDKTIDVPINEETVIDIDDVKMLVKMIIPEGLLDL